MPTKTPIGTYSVNVCTFQKGQPTIRGTIKINVKKADPPEIEISLPITQDPPGQFKLPEGKMDVPYTVEGKGWYIFNVLKARPGIPFFLPSPGRPTGYNWSLSWGKIPTGMTFNTVGALSGIPVLDRKLSGNFTQPQTFTFNITATDAVLGNDTKTFTLKINPPEKPKILSDCPLPDGYERALYPIVFLKAEKGKKEYSWSWAERTPSPTLGANEFNRFPDGLKLSKAGVISGTPILPGKFFFRLTVTDANGLSDEKDCSITIIPAPSIPDTEFPTCWTANKSIDQFCLTAKDGKPGYTWTIVGQSLPKDLVIDKNTGCITGVCKQSGNFSVIVKVTDKNGVSTQKTFSVEVHAPLVITTTCPLPDGDVGKPYSAYLTATGGKQPYTWKIFPQIYISDYSNNVIRKFSEKGNVITYAGNGNSTSVDGTLTTSSFHNPYGIGFDPNGNIYVADYTSGKIRKISSSGSVTTLPGTYGSPEDMVADSSGNVYVSSTSDNSIWKTKEGGTASQLTSSALINHPQGICWDWDGDMILANLGALNILKINPSGTVSIVAGSTGAFTHPHDVKVDFAGNIYVADWSNAIKKITPTGVVSTLASCGVGEPYCLSVDNQGYVYFTSAIQNKIKKASPAGTVTTIAGTGAAGLQNGPALSATFNSPHSVDVNPYEDLPRGLKLNPDTGEISGTPEQPGIYKIIYEVTDACGNVATKNCTIKVEPLILNCAKEIWVVVDDLGDPHHCNHAAFDIFANGVKVMVASVNNEEGSLDWADGGVKSTSAPSTFIFPHRESSSSRARWNEVLIDGVMLQKIALSSISGIIRITAAGNTTWAPGRWNSSSQFHDPIGRLRVYISQVPTGVFSPTNLNLVFDTQNPTLNDNQTNFGTSIAVNVDLCKTITVNSSIQTFSIPNAQAFTQSVSAGGVSFASMALIYSNKNVFNSLQNPFIASYSFKIGSYEITNQQYAIFLNLIAKTDSNNLYNSQMSDIGIQKSSNNGIVSYSVDAGLEDYPVACVSWFDAARYANWMANGKPTGAQSPKTTENGVYNLGASSIVRNAINPNTGKPPTHWLLNESEWYTSAYLKSDATALWAYPTQSNTAPDANGSNPANLANFGSVFDGTTPVGFFDRSPGPCGTFDQAGNVREWTESLDTSSGAPMRIIRGGSWADPASSMKADESHVADPTLEDDKTGFRIGGAP